VNSGSLSLLCNDITIEDGGTVTLQTGAIYEAGTFTIENGGTLIDGSGMVTICGTWNNNSSFVKDSFSTIMFDTENSVSDAAIGTGDTDGDGVADDQDMFPFDTTGAMDHDGDGISDNADPDDDNDGISDEVENAHPDGGDGNNDAISDSLQNNVISLLSYNGLGYVTLESAAGTRLSSCQATDTPSAGDTPTDISFPYGFFSFTINGIGPGDSTIMKLYFPADAVLETYYKYGQTPDNLSDHWYEFLYDNETGAQIDDANKSITLHFVDARKGDDIVVTQDSMVIDIGGPGTIDTSDTPAAISGGGGGGCFVTLLFQMLEQYF
jgi:hypothetical protein